MTYVSDERAVISLDGLRMVKKAEVFGAGNFVLSMYYEGQDITVIYENTEKRDAMFQKIIQAIGAGESSVKLPSVQKYGRR